MTHRIVCFGELLMRLTAPGRELLLQTPRLEVNFGGAEANVAASLATLGHDAAMVSTLPDNGIGRACAGELRRLGVDTRGIRYQSGRMGLYFLAVGALQRPSDILYDRADSAFVNAPADAYDWPSLLQGASWLHICGITPAVSHESGQAALAAVRSARELGVRVSYDCNYRAKLWAGRAEQAPAILQELASQADLLFGNDRDIALMLGVPFAQEQAQERFKAAAAVAFERWPTLQYMAATQRKHHTVDDQELAAMLATRGQFFSTHSWALNGIVDRIGGGDAFAAGLLHGLITGMDPQKAIDFAVAAGCLKHSVPGDANLLTESDMLSFMAGEGLDVRR